MFYCTLFLATKPCLHAGEAVKINMDHSFTGLCCGSRKPVAWEQVLNHRWRLTNKNKAGRNEGLALKVKGMRDRRRATSGFGQTAIFPQFLVLHFHLYGLYGGYYFPIESELQDKLADGVFKKHISFAAARRFFKTAITDAMGEAVSKSFKLGLHTWKTAGFAFRLFALPPWHRAGSWQTLK